MPPRRGAAAPAAALLCAAPAPAAGGAWVVDAVRGDDAAPGTAASPLRSVAGCVARQEGHDPTSCLLRAGRHTEPVLLTGHANVRIAPYPGDDDRVVLDGSRPAAAQWQHEHGDVYSAAVAVTRAAAALVGGEALQCAPAYPASGHGAAEGTACFAWSPAAGWAREFDGAAAAAYFGGRNASAAAGSWWWAGNESGAWRVYADKAAAPGAWPPAVAVKNASAAAFVSWGDGAANLTLDGLTFYATAARGAPTSRGGACHIAAGAGWCATVRRCRFLYSPVTVAIGAKVGSGRGASGPVTITDSVFEFGEGGVSYTGGPSLFEGNWLAFNGIVGLNPAQGAPALVGSMGYEDTFRRNTFLYNAGREIKPWTHGYTFDQNLFVGCGYRGRWTDTAVVHAQVGAQVDIRITGNWFIGPSPVKPVRFDTSKTTTYAGCGHNGTVSGNVWVGHGDAPTIKCDNHTVTHNTGDRLDLVKAWAAIDNMNGHTVAAYNAISGPSARGGSRWPGRTTANACPDRAFCNSDPPPAPMAGEVPEVASVCGELVRCWAAADALTPPPFAWDFRPAANSSLVLAHPATGYDGYIGALPPGGARDPPGRRGAPPAPPALPPR